MKYGRFEDLPVWNDAVDLAVDIFELTKDPVLRRKGDLANQVERATLSISNNVAEGFERGTTQELLTFIYYARGSAGEARSALCVAARIPDLKHLGSQISDLRERAESISRQLRAWADSLQNSAIAGQRHLTQDTKREYDRRQRAEAFMVKAREITEAAMHERKQRRHQRHGE